MSLPDFVVSGVTLFFIVIFIKWNPQIKFKTLVKTYKGLFADMMAEVTYKDKIFIVIISVISIYISFTPYPDNFILGVFALIIFFIIVIIAFFLMSPFIFLMKRLNRNYYNNFFIIFFLSIYSFTFTTALDDLGPPYILLWLIICEGIFLFNLVKLYEDIYSTSEISSILLNNRSFSIYIKYYISILLFGFLWICTALAIKALKAYDGDAVLFSLNQNESGGTLPLISYYKTAFFSVFPMAASKCVFSGAWGTILEIIIVVNKFLYASLFIGTMLKVRPIKKRGKNKKRFRIKPKKRPFKNQRQL